MISPNACNGSFRPWTVSAVSCFGPGSFRPNSVGRFGLVCHEPDFWISINKAEYWISKTRIMDIQIFGYPKILLNFGYP